MHAAKLALIINEMRRNPKGVRFDDLRKLCDQYFGTPKNHRQPLRLQNVSVPASTACLATLSAKRNRFPTGDGYDGSAD